MVMRTQSARCLLAIAAAVGMTTSLLAQTVPVSVDRAGGFAPRKLAEGVVSGATRSGVRRQAPGTGVEGA